MEWQFLKLQFKNEFDDVRNEGHNEDVLVSYMTILLRALKSGNRDRITFSMEQFLDLKGMTKEKCLEYARKLARENNITWPRWLPDAQGIVQDANDMKCLHCAQLRTFLKSLAFRFSGSSVYSQK